ncbi:CPBP family intramembrane glutamic endopeptidase [Streptomyces sp. WG7]|uniref:CPBP family intramembrane glutamic endopeptidase n=1 Tax=Streptomyces sp. WG7 TaxID=3417650 RepID=UPI003CF6DC39
MGGFLRSPWCAVLPQALLFGAAHGWGTVWGLVDLCVFGLVTGHLTLRTGGLEATVALHALNNLVSFGLAAALVNGLASDDTAAGAPVLLALIDMAVTVLYAAVVLRLAHRHRPQRISVGAPRPTPMPLYATTPLPEIHVIRRH